LTAVNQLAIAVVALKLVIAVVNAVGKVLIPVLFKNPANAVSCNGVETLAIIQPLHRRSRQL
jgi:hypothetical protein